MNLIELDEIESTNSYAKFEIDALADRTVVHAIRQSSGRGRLNRKWVDLGEGNLFLSIVLKPSDTYVDLYSNISQYLSVALCRVLERYSLSPKIKWPNDVLIEGRKIAGILAETVMAGNMLKGLVLGIGVNLNSNQVDFAKIPDKVVTSLNLEINKSVDLVEFRDALLEEFFKNYDAFLEKGFETIKSDYITRNCFLGKDLSVQIFNNIEKGVAKSITDSGELLLKKENNEEIVLTIGDIL